MRTTSYLKGICTRLPSSARRSSSSSVAPLPVQSSFSEEITTKLDTLRSSEHEYSSSSWLLEVLDATIATQKVAQEHVIKNSNTIVVSNLDKDVITTYLEDNIEMLDACNGLVEKIDLVHEYANALQATHVKSREMFKECAKLEAKCATMDKCSPKLCKLVGRKDTQHVDNNQGELDLELHEVLSGSRDVASMGCNLVQRALSFKSRQGAMKMKSKLLTRWANSLNQLQVSMNEEAEKRKKCATTPWMMNELEEMIMNARLLQDQSKSSRKGSVDVDCLKRSCRALEQELKPLEERIRELYRHLISIRVALLDVLSRSYIIRVLICKDFM